MKSLRPLCFDTSFSSNYLLPFKREYLTAEIEKHRKQNHCNSQNEGRVSLNACPTDISPQTTLHLLVWFVRCVHVCACLCWGAIINFSSIPTSIISISQSSLSCWGGKQSEGGWVGWQLLRYRKNTTYQTSEPFQLISTGRRPNVLPFGPSRSTHLCCRTCYGNISAPSPASLLFLTHKHAHKMKTERIVSQFISSTSTARQTWQIKEQNSGAAVKIICTQKVLNNGTRNNELKSETAISS